MDPNNYMVCVSCMTYNHAPYIEDTLNGFCMQRTTFPFVCTIIDDASTDGEQEVINNYLFKHFDIEDKSIVQNEETDDYTLTFARHKTNLNCFFAVLYLKYNHYKKKDKKPYVAKWRDNSKYIAICEGDDYWTDPNKLQKQIDFLEQNPEYSMCFHNALEHWENHEKPDAPFSAIENRDYSGVEIYNDWIVPTASVVMKECIYRTDIYLKAIRNPHFIYGDIITFLSCAEYGTLRGMKECMSVYRRHEGGMVFSLQNTEQLLKRSEHHRHIEKVFGNAYKAVSMEKYSSDALLSVSRLRSESKPFILQLFKVFYFQPVKTIKYVFRNVALFR